MGGRSSAVANYQKLLLDWVAHQSALTGLVILLAGLAAGFCGFRMLRPLLVLFGGVVGWLVGLAVGKQIGLPPTIAALGCAALIGLLPLATPRVAAVTASTLTWGVLGGYLAGQIGLKGIVIWLAVGVCGGIGLLQSLLFRRTMNIVFAALLGATLMLMGLVGMGDAIVPSLGSTFRSLAGSWPLLMPVLLAMIAIMSYSYQAMERRGDIQTGSQASANQVGSE